MVIPTSIVFRKDCPVEASMKIRSADIAAGVSIKFDLIDQIATTTIIKPNTSPVICPAVLPKKRLNFSIINSALGYLIHTRHLAIADMRNATRAGFRSCAHLFFVRIRIDRHSRSIRLQLARELKRCFPL
jgi:hypothetical protein